MRTTRSASQKMVSNGRTIVDDVNSRQVKHDVCSVVGSRGSCKTCPSNASVKSKAAFTIAQLKEQQLKDECEQELKAMKEKQKSMLLKAKNEVEMAKLVSSLSVEDIDSDFEQDIVDPQARVAEFVTQCQEHISERDKKVPVTLSGELDELKLMLKPILYGSDLPKVELIPFEGSFSSYWTFVRQFEIYVESKTIDDGQRLLYLLHYCRGRARAAIEECVMLPSDEGYHKARAILKELFGQPHMIANSLLNGLVESSDLSQWSPNSLSNLAIRMQSCQTALKQMNYTSDLDSLTNLEQLVKRFPISLQQQWAEFADKITNNGREPRFEDLTEFVTTRARIANSRFGKLAADSRQKPRSSNAVVEVRSDSRKKQFSFAQSSTRSAVIRYPENCSICGEPHAISRCEKFLSFNCEKRWEVARINRLCFLCLEGSHRSADCRGGAICGTNGCTAHHHPLLHSEKGLVIPVDNRNCNGTKCRQGNVALGLVPVRLTGPNGTIEACALLDNGSDTTVVCGDVLRKLGVSTRPSSTQINTLFGCHSSLRVSQGFELSSLDGLNTVSIDEALVVRDIMPSIIEESRSSVASRWSHLNDLHFDEISAPHVAILIGCDIPEVHWAEDQRIGGRRQPFAVKTILGWILFGPTSSEKLGHASVNCLSTKSFEILEQLKLMYDGEFYDSSSIEKAMSVEDIEVVNLVESKTTLVDGHYVVPLPWKKPIRSIPNNRVVAESRLCQLRRKFIRDPILFRRYADVLESNIAKGYARAVTGSGNGDVPLWYLPHHSVINPKKPEKIRVVFDCAAKHGKLSLNDMLFQGPDTMSNLVGVVLGFRTGRVAVSADIEEMFMQVRVPECDRRALRYLWWPQNNLNEPAAEFEMLVHPFGATSSPFCANYALRRTVADYGHEYEPFVSHAVLHHFYVDDCLTSFDTIEEAQRFASQCRALLERGGFRLRKWVSNHASAIMDLPPSERSVAPVDMSPPAVCSQRALGIEWNANNDDFVFRFNLPQRPLTRRGILSAVSSFYDPLGLVSPLCLSPKVLLQNLCRAGLGWDCPIDSSDASMWTDWLKLVQSIGIISIPRYLKATHHDSSSQVELHVFCDASELGYGVVAYARYIFENHDPYCSLLFGKSRVAPLKTVTVPRLELAAAVLAVRVSELIKSAMPHYFSSIVFWTDSMIVLYYLNDSASRFATFVANRLSIIHQYSSPTQWQHVKSNDNIADLSSRGIQKKEDLELWIAGPKFLKHPLELQTLHEIVIRPDTLELKKKQCMITCKPTSSGMAALFARYSSWFKLLKAVGWLIRFVYYIRMEVEDSFVPVHGRISVQEMREARRRVIMVVQAEVYSMEMEILRQRMLGNYTKETRLINLCPVLVNGIICVGGRLDYADYSHSRRHPAILPNRHVVTDMIVRHYHETEGHSGTSHVLGMIRRNFWIIHGRSAVKRIIGSCVRCKRNAPLCKQMMSPLPVSRIEKGSRCFECVGVDYFGPFSVKRGRSLEKRYGCVFTCLKVRAVHLEIAHSLSTDSFIMALMRFISRRGKPMEIFSDNGSNFIGTVNELREHIHHWDQGKIHDRLAIDDIQWHFNPPNASHRGGIWERVIRSVRKILNSLANEQVLSDETLLTFFSEVERILNNRPLVAISTDSRDAEVLTPNHLLLLESNPGIPSECSLRERYTRRWKQVNHLSAVFWSRWIKDYLPTLQIRNKWTAPAANLNKGDLVLVASDKTTRGSWPLALVAETQVDPDGLVRTVLVRSATGLMKRDVRSLCLLEGAQ